MNITEFLDARIAEDEAESRKYQKYEDQISETAGWWEPTRALAECAAKRAIIEEHSPVDYSGIGMASPNACNLCGVEKTMADWEWDKNSFPCKTLRALASVYKEHHEYQKEWTL